MFCFRRTVLNCGYSCQSHKDICWWVYLLFSTDPLETIQYTNIAYMNIHHGHRGVTDRALPLCPRSVELFSRSISPTGAFSSMSPFHLVQDEEREKALEICENRLTYVFWNKMRVILEMLKRHTRTNKVYKTTWKLYATYVRAILLSLFLPLSLCSAKCVFITNVFFFKNFRKISIRKNDKSVFSSILMFFG